MISYHLDELLASYRKSPAPVTFEQSRDFLETAWRANAARTSFFKRIVQGGIFMSIIAAVIISLSMLLQPQPDAVKSKLGTVTQQAPGTTQLQTNNPTPHKSGALAFTQKEQPAQDRSTATETDTGTQQNNVSLPPVWLQSTLPAGTGAPERIEPLALFQLDSLELEQIGIRVASDGCVNWRQYLEKPVGWWSWISALKYIGGGRIENTIDNLTFQRLRKEGFPLQVLNDAFTASGSEPVTLVLKDCRCRVIWISDSRKTLMYGHWNKTELSVLRPELKHKSIQEMTPAERTSLDSLSDHIPNVLYNQKSDDITFVPIKVRSTLLSWLRYPTEEQYFIFWFEKTPELLRALPVCVSSLVDPAFVPEKDTCQEFVQKQMETGSTKTCSVTKSFAMSLFPNPTRGSSTTIRISFTEARHFTIGLYDILGKKLRDVAKSSAAAKQSWEQVISLDGLSAGIYLVAVTTDRGEQTVRQIIKN